MLTTQKILQDFLNALFLEYDKEGVKYCLLRNFETLPDQLKSRDIDIRILFTDRILNRSIIISLANKHGVQIYHHYVDERFDQFCLFRRTSLGDLFSLKLDYYDLELYGVRLLSGSDTLEGRVPYRNFHVANDVFKFLDKWLFIYLLGASLPEKYHTEFKDIFVNNRETLAIILMKIFGQTSAEQLASHICSIGFNGLPHIGKGKLLYLLLRLAFKDPFYHLLHVPLFFWFHLKHFINPKGEFISLSGPDGCGKTTVMEMAKEQLNQLFGLETDNEGHFRPNILPRIAQLAKRVGAITEVDENYESPHRGKPSTFIGSFIRFSYYLLDYFMGYFLKIRPALVRRELVIYDRYYFDMVADPGRSRIALPAWLRKAALSIIPLPHTSFFIRVPSDEVRKRKQELSVDKIEQLNSAYLQMAETAHLQVLDNSDTAEAAAAKLVDTVIARRRKRLKLDRIYP